MGNYEENREWADGFVGQAKAILGPLLLQEADFDVDTKKATDFVLVSGATHIACRIRKHSYFENDRFRYQITIRDKYDSGTPSEFQKIFSEQKPDWGFYGFADKEDRKLAAWVVWDVTEFRRAIVNRVVRKPKPVPNGDGTHFLAFDIFSFPDSFVVAHSGYLEEQENNGAAA